MPLPASVKSWLADLEAGQHPDVGGLPLTRQMPTTSDLRRSVAILEQRLKAPEYDHVVFCVAKLITGFNERLTKDEAKIRARLWHEVISDVPTDLWSAGTIELLRTWKRDDHFGRVPEAADLRASIEDVLQRRRADLRSCKAALAQANAAETKAAEPTGPARAKPPTFAEILEEQRNRPGLTDEQRLHVMAHTERSRANTERTPMANWAWEYFDRQRGSDRASAGAAMRTVVARSSPTGKRLAELANARRDGTPPPEHRDIPEGAVA